MDLRLVCAAAAAFLVTGDGAALATTVTYTYRPAPPPADRYDYPTFPTEILAVEAAAGETNTVTAERAGDDTIQINDTAGIQDPLSSECARLDPFTVRCPEARTMSVRVHDLADVVTVGRRISFGIAGGDGDDTLRGGDVVAGEQGDDILDSRTAIARYGASVNGGPGADLVYGSGGDDRLDGGDGLDRLLAEAGDDLLSGGGGRDRLMGEAGDDSLGDGDTSESADADVLDGGSGFDTIAYGYVWALGEPMEAGRSDAVSVDLVNQPSIAGQASEGDEIAGFEDAVGGLGPDRLVVGDGMRASGGVGADVLVGDAGAQTLYPGEDSDEVHSGGGDDTVFLGGREPEYADLGSGVDTVDLASPARIDLERPGWPLATKYVRNAENVVAGGSEDVLLGSDTANFLDGLEGNDVIHGRDGDDSLRGSFDNDEISGGRGDDRLNGYTGHDAIRGGAGNDRIVTGSRSSGWFHAGYGDTDRAFGGPGNDQLWGYWGDDALRGGPGRDSLRGGVGSDTLAGGTERDMFDGGLGGDRIRAYDRTRDDIMCGAGRDIGRADARDLLFGCELLRQSKNEGRQRRPS